MIYDKEIVDRWNKRIVPNGLDAPDGSGVVEYLMRWGKNISDEKLEKFADYAKKLGLDIVAEEFIANTTYGWYKRSGDPFLLGFNRNFSRMYYHNYDRKKDDFSLFTSIVCVIILGEYNKDFSLIRKIFRYNYCEKLGLTNAAIIQYPCNKYIIVVKIEESERLDFPSCPCYITDSAIPPSIVLFNEADWLLS